MGSAKVARAVAAALTMSSPMSSAGARGAEPGAAGRFEAMVGRPLFSATRRPPPPPTAPSAAPVLPDLPPPGPDLSLSGVIAGGGGGLALVKRPQDQTPVRVALGGQIDGWLLTEIHPRSVVLRRDARSVTVELPAAPR